MKIPSIELWELRVVAGVLHAVRQDGGAHIEMEVPGTVIDYVGDGCIVRGYVAERLLVIMEKVGGPSVQSIR